MYNHSLSKRCFSHSVGNQIHLNIHIAFNSPKYILMSYDAYYSIYDNESRYVGFTDTLEDAISMANGCNDHYVLEFSSSDSIFG